MYAHHDFGGNKDIYIYILTKKGCDLVRMLHNVIHVDKSMSISLNFVNQMRLSS